MAEAPRPRSETSDSEPATSQADARARLLDAAARVYAQDGYAGATTRLIAREADVNEVTLFRLFRSKDALVDEAVRARPRGRAAREIRGHVGRLHRRGLIGAPEHAAAASSMLMVALLSDALAREQMPEVYPSPAADAPQAYVRAFFAALGAGRSSS